MKIREYYFDILEDYRDTQGITVVKKEDVKGNHLIKYPCHLFLDQSTCTGYVIVDDNRRLIKGGHVEKGAKDSLESYKYGLKDIILKEVEEFKTKNEDRYLMLYYKTNKFSGKLKSSKEGNAFWIKREDINKYKLSLDLKRILKVMESNELSEIIYYEKNNKWISKIV